MTGAEASGSRPAPTRESAARAHALGRTLDTAPVTRRRLMLWILAACGIGLDGFDLFIMSTAGPLITADFGLGPWGKSIAVGAAVVGAVPGALLSGRLADRIGRQNMLKIDIVIFTATAILSALSPNVWWLAFFRFWQGFAVGAEYPLSASLISEIMPSRTRTKWITGAFAFQALGMALAAFTSLLILTIHPDVSAWRWMLLAGAVPAALVAVLRLGQPESPRWEAGRGNVDRAEEDTTWLTGLPVVVEEADRVAVEKTWLVQEKPATYGALFKPGMRRILVLCAVPWFLMDIALYGVGLFAPSIITGLMFTDPGDGSTSFLRDDIEATAITGFTDVFLVVGFILTILFVQRIGQIRLQIIGFIGMTIGLSLLAATGKEGSAALILIGFVIFNLMLNFGPNATTYMLPAQLFPTRIRATGHGFSAASGKVGAV
ncbi:MAG: MFS transporter, partial [Actinomycetota bacterium]|nr:MFS transporter [Actinomycetota bacterium]